MYKQRHLGILILSYIISSHQAKSILTGIEMKQNKCKKNIPNILLVKIKEHSEKNKVDDNSRSRIRYPSNRDRNQPTSWTWTDFFLTMLWILEVPSILLLTSDKTFIHFADLPPLPHRQLSASWIKRRHALTVDMSYHHMTYHMTYCRPFCLRILWGIKSKYWIYFRS